MTNYARIVDSMAIELFTPQEGFTLEDSWHPDVAVLFTEVPDNVTVNSTVSKDGKWTIFKQIDNVPTVVYKKVSPMDFQMLFTSKERIAMKTTIKTDEILEDWWSIVTNPQLTEVDLGLSSVQEALDYLVSLSIISEERKTEILSGQVK